MWAFLLKRLFHMIPILLGVSLLTYLLMSLAPGDFYSNLAANPQVSPEKLAELRAKRHLDKPWYVRYAYWLKGACQGDFGYSVAYKIDASSLIAARLWNTFAAVPQCLARRWLDDRELGRRIALPDRQFHLSRQLGASFLFTRPL